MKLILFMFIFFYPLFMAVYWMTGAIIFFNRRERRGKRPPELKSYPKVSVLVPCHNEESCIRDAILQLDKNNYPNFEIIAINDGSTDNTGEILYELTKQIDKLKVITLTSNYGKAMALKAGAMGSSAEFLMCIDADALLDRDALFWMMKHFEDSPRVGAVTGNPRVINKTSLLARIQIGEFSAIVGMVKRTQRNIGRVFTVSGVNACFRKAALHDVGYWSSETVTEDIDISWKLQLRYWDIRYEPQALTWILVPETLKALWNQRLRWAQGGFEAAVKFGKEIFRWKNRRMWNIAAEYWISVLWCYAVAFTVLCFAGTHLAPEGVWPEVLKVPTLVPGWTGVALAVVCLLQFTVGLVLDSLYERRGLFRYLFWAIWYPAVYWCISAATTVVAVPKGLRKLGKTRYAVWTSPVRKLQYVPFRLRKNKKNVEQRRLFWKILPASQKYIELLITAISWTLWAYLITPLMSVLVWWLGAKLFQERMLSPGGLETFANALSYGGVVLVMWLTMAGWIIWNKQRYGKRNRRLTQPQQVSSLQAAEVVGIEPPVVEMIRNSKEVSLHYNDEDHVVIEYLDNELARQKPVIRFSDDGIVFDGFPGFEKA
jgi:biofilm PGA synthesis N-glycosyltransferase PgaC